jgi:hypothetical protein
MPWIWNSWEEYLAAVYPVAVDRGGGLWHAKKDTWFENVCRLCKAVRTLEDSPNSLRELGFTGKDHSRPPDDPAISQQANNLVLEAVYAGEELLFFDKRLCMAAHDSAYGFRHQKSILEHWDRYSTTTRIAREIHQLVKDIDVMLSGYYALTQTDTRLIVGNLDLPDSLEADFRLARDLFSAGFDETALLIAGRGLEGVLRKNRNAFWDPLGPDFADGLLEVVFDTPSALALQAWACGLLPGAIRPFGGGRKYSVPESQTKPENPTTVSTCLCTLIPSLLVLSR